MSLVLQIRNAELYDPWKSAWDSIRAPCTVKNKSALWTTVGIRMTATTFDFMKLMFSEARLLHAQNSMHHEFSKSFELGKNYCSSEFKNRKVSYLRLIANSISSESSFPTHLWVQFIPKLASGVNFFFNFWGIVSNRIFLTIANLSAKNNWVDYRSG